MNPVISVVVPTYKRPDLLKRCLDALETQTLERSEYEIIVAEDIFHEGPAAARNRGWRQAAAPLIAFTDDDCIPGRDWLRAGVSAFAEGIVAVWGKLVMPIPDPPTDYEKDAAGLAGAEFVTANCFCLRSALEKIGGFDERFRLAWREDSDLYFRLLPLGRIIQEPRAMVIHPVRPARWGVSLSQQKKSVFDALLYKKHPALFRSKIDRRPPWRYYAIVGSFLVAAGTASLSAGLLWLALTAEFCWKRLRSTSRTLSHVLEMAVTSILIPPVALFWRWAGALRFRVLFL